jgi:protocatechuate 3,4-dioxygenase beta subunit
MPPARTAAAAGVAALSLALCGTVAAQKPPTSAGDKPASRPAPAPPRLEGTVRDAAGKPIEKALVMAWPVSGDRFERTATTRTDASGRFALTLPRRGDYYVRVETAGLAPHTIDRLSLPAAPLTVTLRKGAVLEGVVRDARGRPVAGARVEARTGGRLGAMLAEPEAGRVRVTTDAGGAFKLEGLAVAACTVTASAPGLGGARRSATPGTKLELYLTPGASVRGTVRGPDRRPLAGASVLVEPAMFGGSGATTSVERTDNAGRFEAFGLAPPGAWHVIAFHTDFAPTVMPVTLQANAEARLDLALGPAARARGRLVDADQRPLRGTLVLQELDGEVVRPSLGELLRAESDEQGRFTIERLPRAPLALGVTARSYAPRRLEAAPAAAELDLGDVVMERGLVIRGRVRDADGRAIADAKVQALMQQMPLRRTTADGFTEVDGTFLLAGLEPGLYSVRAEASGYGMGTARTTAGGEPADIVLQIAGSITGTVVDEKGAPVPAFDVSATPTEQGESFRPAWGDGSEGRFELTDVAAGEWLVLVKAPEKVEGRVSGVKVRMGAATDVGRVRLTPGVAVRGRVTDSAGSPVAGANVSTETPGRFGPVQRAGSRGAFSDMNGAFELSGLEPGRVDVVADHPDYARSRAGGVDVDPALGATDVRITLTRGGRVEGTVRRRDGRPVERATVRVGSMNSSSTSFGVVAPDGTYSVEHVQAGAARATLQLTTGDNLHSSAQTRPVEVREGETATADFLLRDIVLSGTITRRGEPAAGVKVTLRGQTMGGMFYMAPAGVVPAAPVGPQRGWAVTRQDGGYELLLDEPGTYMASVTSADGRINYPMRTVEVADADATTADFAFGGVLVSGQVVDAEASAPVSSASVSAMPTQGEDRRPAGANAGADGRFQLELDPGEVTLSARAQGYAPARTTVTVGENGLSDVRLSLARGGTISGRVVDATGRPGRSMFVGAFPEGEMPPGISLMSRTGFASSAPDGSFTITGLSDGRYALRAGDELAGFGAVPDVAVGATGVVLRLQPGGRVRATVLSADGSPAASTYVMVSKVDGRPTMGGGRPGQTNAAGVAEFAAPPGTLEVRAMDAKEEGTATATVTAGETASVEIRLQPRKKGPGTR